MGSWRKGLKSRVEFVFVDAPHLVLEESTLEERESGRSWWLWEDTDLTPRPSKATKYKDWIPSIDIISQALVHHAPIDGFIGFSQGATMLALFLAHLNLENLLPGNLPRFAIVASGFLPRDVEVADRIVQGKPSINSLHIYGRTDTLVESSRSQDLMSTFHDCRTEDYEHEGAHMMPTCTGLTKSKIVQFLDTMNRS